MLRTFKQDLAEADHSTEIGAQGDLANLVISKPSCTQDNFR